MIHTNELSEATLVVLDVPRPRVKAAAQDLTAVSPPRLPGQISLTGTQLLTGFLFTVSLATLLIWGFIKFWLFAP